MPCSISSARNPRLLPRQRPRRLQQPADLLGRYAKRLIATHLHDNDGSQDQHRLPMPGEGKADWPRIVGVLKESSYGGPVNLEVGLPPGTDLDAFCRRGYKVLSGCGAVRPRLIH